MKSNTQLQWYLKIFIMIELAVLAFTGIFYFSCGRSLYERESDGNISEIGATNDVGELLAGGSVEQTYTSQMDRITIWPCGVRISRKIG